MRTRFDLQEELENIMGNDHVYFQPPETVKMIYPCIVYEKRRVDFLHADNRPYKKDTAYQITVIDRNPDSDIPGRIEELPQIQWVNHFTHDNLHHFVYQLYY